MFSLARPRRVLLPLALTAAALLAACQGDDKDPPLDEDTTGARVIFELAERNNSGVTVEADLTEEGDEETTVSLSFSGVPDDSEIVSSIYSSDDCDELGGQPAFELNPLDGDQGASQSSLDVAMSELQRGDYLISVTPADEESPQLACGSIPNPRS